MSAAISPTKFCSPVRAAATTPLLLSESSAQARDYRGLLGFSQEWWQERQPLDETYAAFEASSSTAAATLARETAACSWMDLLLNDGAAEPCPAAEEKEAPRTAPLEPIFSLPAPAQPLAPVIPQPRYAASVTWPPLQAFVPLPAALVPSHQPPLTLPPLPLSPSPSLAVAQERMEAEGLLLVPESPVVQQPPPLDRRVGFQVRAPAKYLIGTNPNEWPAMADMFYPLEKFTEARDRAKLAAARERFLREMQRLAADPKTPRRWSRRHDDTFILPTDNGYVFASALGEPVRTWKVLYGPCFPLTIRLETYVRFTLTALLLSSRHYGAHLKDVNSDDFVVGCLDSRGVFFLPRVSGNRPDFTGSVPGQPRLKLADNWITFPRYMPVVTGTKLGYYLARLPSHLKEGKLVGPVDSRHKWRNQSDRRHKATLRRVLQEEEYATEEEGEEGKERAGERASKRTRAK